MHARNKFWSSVGRANWETGCPTVRVRVCPSQRAAAGQTAPGATVLSVERGGLDWSARRTLDGLQSVLDLLFFLT